MKRVLGCDISANFIILHDGKQAVRIDKPEDLKDLNLSGSVVVLEQTGSYGVRWATLLETVGARVYIADGKDFKNFRLGYTRKKNDSLDAMHLRKYYLEKPHKCRPFNPQEINIRALIRQHIRNEKDITKHYNRLIQYMQIIDPKQDPPSRAKLFKNIDTYIQELKNSPHTISNLAIAEAEKLKICLRANEQIEQELKNIAQNHPDYQVLKTFPLGDLQIAVILAYSWNIKNFPTKEQYIGYTLTGATIEQSGSSLYRVKTDKARTEIKGLLYPLFMQAHRKTQRWTHPLYPLAQHVKQIAPARNNYKKRYIKFLSRLLELTYYARRDKTDYKTTIQNKIARLQEEHTNTKHKEGNLKIHNINRAIKTYQEMLNLAQYKDISGGKNPAELPAYLCQEETNHENTTNYSTTNNTNTKPKPEPSRRPTKNEMHKRKMEDNLRQEQTSNKRNESRPTRKQTMQEPEDQKITIYHIYIETITNTPYDPQHHPKYYYDKLPKEFKIPQMKDFLSKLRLYPDKTTLEELRQAWENIKKRVVFLRPPPWENKCGQ